MKRSFLFLIIAAFVMIDLPLMYAQAVFNTGKISVNATNGGRIRILTPSNTRQIDRLSALVSAGQNAVFDYTNDANGEVNAALVATPSKSDYEIFSVLNNTYPATPFPPDVLVKQSIYGWNDGEYLLIKFNIINHEASSINARIGLDIIPQVDGTYDGDIISYDAAKQILKINQTSFVGIKLLSQSPASVRYLEWYSGYSVDSSLYSWLNSNSFDTAPFGPADADGIIAFMAGQTVALASGDSTELYFAVALGADLAAMESNINQAADKYLLVVPVELTAFSAVSSDGKVILNWNTATETNNRGFEIERKTGRQGEWVTIAFKDGKGTTSENQSYSYTDNVEDLTSKTLVYRLKQIDFDGSFSYSYETEVEVDITPNDFSLAQNYPNPFNPSTRITFTLPTKENVVLKIFNALGEEISTLVNSGLEAGKYSVDFDAGNLSSGIYFYKLNAGTFSSIKKMTITK